MGKLARGFADSQILTDLLLEIRFSVIFTRRESFF